MLETSAYFNCLKKNDEDDTKCSIERQALAKCSMLLNVRIVPCAFLLLCFQGNTHVRVHTCTSLTHTGSLYSNVRVCMYVYIYICVCVCVSTGGEASAAREEEYAQLPSPTSCADAEKVKCGKSPQSCSSCGDIADCCCTLSIYVCIYVDCCWKCRYSHRGGGALFSSSSRGGKRDPHPDESLSSVHSRLLLQLLEIYTRALSLSLSLFLSPLLLITLGEVLHHGVVSHLRTSDRISERNTQTYG